MAQTGSPDYEPSDIERRNGYYDDFGDWHDPVGADDPYASDPNARPGAATTPAAWVPPAGYITVKDWFAQYPNSTSARERGTYSSVPYTDNDYVGPEGQVVRAGSGEPVWNMQGFQGAYGQGGANDGGAYDGGTGGGAQAADMGGWDTGGGDGGNFAWPTYSGPSYTPSTYTPGPAFQAPPPFSYEAFNAPSLDEARGEPGYAFAMEQGRKALENAAAARGTLRTGGTLKDLFSWGNKFGEQNYGNVYNRKANTWSMNRNNAADTYSTNYGIGRDVWDRGDQQGRNTFILNTGEQQAGFDRNRQSALDAFNPQQKGAELSFEDMYRRWRDALDAQTRIGVAGAGL